MSRLRIYPEHDAGTALEDTDDGTRIAALLATEGVRFERWQANVPLAAGAEADAVIAAYRGDIDRLMAEKAYRSFDVISIAPDHPQKDALRSKFLNEHRHREDEVRFFVAGCGLFFLHLGTRVLELHCEQGDLIGVPDGARHWFDMGPNPSFIAIRIFSNPDGWVAEFSGDDIADRFPRLEN